MRSLDEFEKKIGYKFKNRNLLITALTHSSYANESRGGDQSYERLEFLGDSILGFVTAEYLCKAFPDIPEGKLTKKRAALVCEKSLCGFTRSFGAGELLRLSHGEQHSGGTLRWQRTSKHLSGRVRIHYGGDLSRFRQFGGS
mgnify:CR=1 FL=1